MFCVRVRSPCGSPDFLLWAMADSLLDKVWFSPWNNLFFLDVNQHSPIAEASRSLDLILGNECRMGQSVNLLNQLTEPLDIYLSSAALACELNSQARALQKCNEAV